MKWMRTAVVLSAVPWAVWGQSSGMVEDFENQPQTRWAFVADGVMGGVSQGRAQLVDTDRGPAVRLTGTVSTENNGGFVQVRYRLPDPWPDDAQGLQLLVRGNGETYYVFLRPRHAQRRWHSFRHAFPTTTDWAEVVLPFEDFAPSHAGMANAIAPSDVVSIGIVAYGRDHDADLTVGHVSLY